MSGMDQSQDGGARASTADAALLAAARELLAHDEAQRANGRPNGIVGMVAGWLRLRAGAIATPDQDRQELGFDLDRASGIDGLLMDVALHEEGMRESVANSFYGETIDVMLPDGDAPLMRLAYEFDAGDPSVGQDPYGCWSPADNQVGTLWHHATAEDRDQLVGHLEIRAAKAIEDAELRVRKAEQALSYLGIWPVVVSPALWGEGEIDAGALDEITVDHDVFADLLREHRVTEGLVRPDGEACRAYPLLPLGDVLPAGVNRDLVEDAMDMMRRAGAEVVIVATQGLSPREIHATLRDVESATKAACEAAISARTRHHPKQ